MVQGKMEKTEVINLMNQFEKERAQAKVAYWINAGSAILDSEVSQAKWGAFVEKQAADDFARGALIDETLQVMTMLKANLPYEMIAQTVASLPSGQTILDVYLSEFVHPEIIEGIKLCLPSKEK